MTSYLTQVRLRWYQVMQRWTSNFLTIWLGAWPTPTKTLCLTIQPLPRFQSKPSPIKLKRSTCTQTSMNSKIYSAIGTVLQPNNCITFSANKELWILIHISMLAFFSMRMGICRRKRSGRLWTIWASKIWSPRKWRLSYKVSIGMGMGMSAEKTSKQSSSRLPKNKPNRSEFKIDI